MTSAKNNERAMPFQPGKSGNRLGRTPGKPNSNTLAVRSRILSEVDPIAFLATVMRGEAIVRPDGGEVLSPSLTDMIGAAKVLAGKVAPDAKDGPVSFKLDRLERAEDVTAALADLAKQVAAGEITPSEAAGVGAVLKLYADSLAVTDFEKRLADIEGRLAK